MACDTTAARPEAGPDDATKDFLTPQLRAARVAAAFLSEHRLHIRDVMRLTDLSRRASYNLLEMLSGTGGIPIRQTGEGYWEITTDTTRPERRTTERRRPAFKIHPNTRAAIAFFVAQQGRSRTGQLAQQTGLQFAEVRWLLGQLQRSGLPIRETAADVWEVGDDGGR